MNEINALRKKNKKKTVTEKWRYVGGKEKVKVEEMKEMDVQQENLTNEKKHADAK